MIRRTGPFFPALFTAIAAALLLGVAGPAAAAAGGGDNPLQELIFSIVNLAILLGVIVYFARKPIIAFFADRREQISSDLDEAAEVLEKAEGRFAEWQRKLIELDREMEQIRSDGRDRAQAEYEGIIADARAVAERIKRDAEAAVDQELRRARNELRDEAALLATELAEKLMREQIGDPDRERLLDEFITRIESGESAAQ